MARLNQIKKVIIQSGGIAKTSDFTSAGITRNDLVDYCKTGDLERIRQGYYQLKSDHNITEGQYLSALLPEGIVCTESALFFYGYSDFTPRVWTVAVPRSISLAKLKFDVVPIKSHFVQNDQHDIGKTIEHIDGADIAIYDRERTICDCFKYRTKMDRETFNKAIKAYAADDKKDLNRLIAYAKELGVYNKVMDVMGVVLND